MTVDEAPVAETSRPITREVVLALAAALCIVVWPRLAGLVGSEPSTWVRDVVAALVQAVAAGTAGVMALMTARRGLPELRRSWTLIGLGTAAAYVYSVVATLAPGVFPATFLQDGRIGETVRLRNRDSGRIVSAVVVGPNAARLP